VPIVTEGGTVTAGFPLDRFTLVALVAAIVKLTVHVELPGGVNVPGVQLRLDNTGAGASRVRVAVFDVPFKLAVSSAEPLALTAAAALAVKVVLDVPVPIVTEGGTVTAGFPLDRFTLVALVAAIVKLTVQVELPGGVNVLGEQMRLESTGTGALSVRVVVLELPLSTAVKSAEVLALTAAGALAVNVVLVTPEPIVTKEGNPTAGLPLDKLTLVALVAGFVRLTVHVELPGGINVLGAHVKLERTGAGGFRVSVAVCELPLNVAVKIAEAVALTAAAALAVNVVLDVPVPIVTEAGTVTAPFPLDKLTLIGLVAVPVRLTVQVELPGGVNVLGAHVKLESVGGGRG
jgi:primosomal replication protein N